MTHFQVVYLLTMRKRDVSVHNWYENGVSLCLLCVGLKNKTIQASEGIVKHKTIIFRFKELSCSFLILIAGYVCWIVLVIIYPAKLSLLYSKLICKSYGRYGFLAFICSAWTSLRCPSGCTALGCGTTAVQVRCTSA